LRSRSTGQEAPIGAASKEGFHAESSTPVQIIRRILSVAEA
jgi:hypothetical protein